MFAVWRNIISLVLILFEHRASTSLIYLNCANMMEFPAFPLPMLHFGLFYWNYYLWDFDLRWTDEPKMNPRRVTITAKGHFYLPVWYKVYGKAWQPPCHSWDQLARRFWRIHVSVSLKGANLFGSQKETVCSFSNTVILDSWKVRRKII